MHISLPTLQVVAEKRFIRKRIRAIKSTTVSSQSSQLVEQALTQLSFLHKALKLKMRKLSRK